MDSNTMLAPNRTFEALVWFNILVCKIEKRFVKLKRLTYSKQFITSSNKLTNLSRQVELVGSDEQKFEGFKILNNNILNDVQTRPNNNPISFRPTNHYTLCSPCAKFVTYHVNLLTGKFSKQFWLAMFSVIDVALLQLERTLQIFLFTEYKIQSHTNSTPKLNNSEASTRLYYQYLQRLVMLLLMYVKFLLIFVSFCQLMFQALNQTIRFRKTDKYSERNMFLLATCLFIRKCANIWIALCLTTVCINSN
ncbi:Hypothetical_protein [Hexamita inflata]|uniref:Hypothetical_protein n=1 Tax=Hexamita inflata TaxID=28002 RepID=A0AA86Q0T2_9EUKA|nr:Hypothetical protein HINF_LOCUS32092 [Hexamita inflata]